MEIKSAVGKINVNLNKIGGDLILKGGTRGATISVPVDAPINIKHSNNKKVKIQASTSSLGSYLFDLKPNVGVIKVVN